MLIIHNHRIFVEISPKAVVLRRHMLQLGIYKSLCRVGFVNNDDVLSLVDEVRRNLYSPEDTYGTFEARGIYYYKYTRLQIHMCVLPKICVFATV